MIKNRYMNKNSSKGFFQSMYIYENLEKKKIIKITYFKHKQVNMLLATLVKHKKKNYSEHYMYMHKGEKKKKKRNNA